MDFKDPKDQRSSKIKSFLRRNDSVKLEDFDKTATPSDNKEFLTKKLTEAPKNDAFTQSYEAPRLSWRQRFDKARYLLSFYKRRSFKDTIPIVTFVSFSCLILWKMEEQLDSMRRKVIVQKTVKQQEIEKENELIEQALKDNVFKNNLQIQEVEPQLKYRFEDDFDEEDEGHINTKGDVFLELDRQENISDLPENAVSIDPRFEEEMRDFKRKQAKRLFEERI